MLISQQRSPASASPENERDAEPNARANAAKAAWLIMTVSQNTLRTADQLIPLCKRPFLQDVTIALGRKSKGFRHGLRKFSCTCARDPDLPEQLTITCELFDRAIVSLDIREDRSARLQLWRPLAGRRTRYRWSFAPSLEALSPEGIVSALKQTHEHASEVYYGPDYLDRIRRFWAYTGSVGEEGDPKKANQPSQPMPLKRHG